MYNVCMYVFIYRYVEIYTYKYMILKYIFLIISVILGNAYLSLFFSKDQSPKILKQCMSAYQQAVSTLINIFKKKQ